MKKTLMVTLGVGFVVGVLFQFAKQPVSLDRSREKEVANEIPAAETVAGTPLSKPLRSPSAAKGATTPQFIVCAKVEDAPVWTVPFGHEFWRRPSADVAPASGTAGGTSKPLPANLNLGDMIERVSHAIEREPATGLLQTRDRAYSAVFDGEGFRLSPHRRTGESTLETPTGIETVPLFEPDSSADVSFRTISVQQGGETVYSKGGNQLTWSVVGNTAQALLNEQSPLVEHYEVRGEGIEVSWIINQRPSGSGAIRIESELTGLSYDGESETGHHFADAEGNRRIRVGGVQVVDARGNRTSVPLVVAESRLQLEVPESLWANAAFPIAIDPTIGVEFGLGIVMAAGEQGRPKVAYNGSQYLAVWFDDRNSATTGRDVYGALVASSGEVLTPSGLAINTGSGTQDYPDVASSGSGFLVVWVSSTGVNGARVTSTGTVQDPAGILIGSGGNYPSVSSIGTSYLVVWNATEIRGARVSSAGAVLDPSGFSISSGNIGTHPDVAANGSIYLVVWQDERNYATLSYDIYGARVNTSGTVLDPSSIAINSYGGNQERPAVASDGTDFLVVWQSLLTGYPDFDIRASRVTAAGVPSGGTFGVAVATGVGHQTEADLACAGGQYYAVWQDGSTFSQGQRVDTNGSPLSPISTFSAAVDPTVVGAGDKFLVAWKGYSQLDIFGTRITTGGIDLDVTDLRLSTAAPYTQRDVSIGLGPNAWLVVWRDDRNLATTGYDIYGARVDSFGNVPSFELNGRAFCTAAGHQYVPKVAGSFNAAEGYPDHLIVWADDRNAGTSGRDIYGTYFIGTGSFTDPVGFPISTASGTQSYPTVAYNGTVFLVAWDDTRSSFTNSDIYCSRVDQEMVVLDPSGIVVSTAPNSQTTPAMASIGTNFLVVWSDRRSGNNDIYGARVAGTGTVLDATGLAISTATGNQVDPAVAANGTDYLVVWDDYRNGTQPDIYGSRVTAGGSVSDPLGIAISTAGAIQYYPSVASIGTEFFVVWADTRNGSGTDIFGARVSGAGAVLDSTGIAVNTLSANQDKPAVASGGGKYLVAYQSTYSGTLKLRANLVTP